MQNDKFEEHLNEHAEQWVRTTEYQRPGRRIDDELNVEGAFPVVLKFKTRYNTCSWCGEPEIKGKTYKLISGKKCKWQETCRDCKQMRILKAKDLKNNK